MNVLTNIRQEDITDIPKSVNFLLNRPTQTNTELGIAVFTRKLLQVQKFRSSAQS